jgi:hypothetical protein
MIRRDVAASEVRYFVLPNVESPWLLAQVRWPDVFQAISPCRPHSQSDPGLFDLPYDPAGVRITADVAEAIAVEWGAPVPTESSGAVAPSFIRRMPANWSSLTSAERRAWSIEREPRRRLRRRERPRGYEAVGDAWSGAVIDLRPAPTIDLRPTPVIDLTDGVPADVSATVHE